MSERTATGDAPEIVGEAVATSPGVLLCLDFDGTLAPIVDNPDDARLSGTCHTRLRELADRPAVEVAVVSGRDLDDLVDRVGIEEITYAGNHGLELRRERRREVHPEAVDSSRAIRRVCERIERHTASIPGVIVENKGVTATVHFRQVPDEDVADVVRTVEAVVGDADADLELTEGKAIRELRPRVEWDKGSVVQRLAEAVPDEWLTVYVGDDTTDEDAFEVVEPEGVAVHVGTGETVASCHVETQAEVPDLLDHVADQLA